MRIDASVQLAATPAIQQEQGAASFLQQGDVIRAQVLSGGDGAVSLRTEDGRMFIAKLIAEAMLMPNDQAELLVVESALDRLVFRLIYVEPGVPKFPELPVEKAVVSQQQQALTPELAELLQAFDGMEGKPSSGTISLAQRMMQEQGIDAKAAAFFAANDMEFSEESMRAVKGFTEAGTGKTLLKLSQAVQSDTEKVRTQDSSVEYTFREGRPNSLQPQVQKPVLQVKNSAVHGDQPAQIRTAVIGESQILLGQNISKESKGAAGQTGKPNDATFQNTKTGSKPEAVLLDAQKGSISQKTTQSETIGKSSTVMSPKQSAVPSEYAADTPAAVGQEDANPQKVSGEQENNGQSGTFATQRDPELRDQSIPEKVLSLFAQAEEGMDAQSLKKSADGMRNQLSELQEMLRHTDIHDKSAVLAQLDDVQAQAKLTQDISRFLCMQIPVHMKGYETAELYVYRRNRKSGKIDPENTSIVLGISTQNLGRVEALIRVENRAISIGFSIENEAAVPAFQEEAIQLKKTLAGMRYSLAECRVTGLKERTTPLNAEEVLSFSVKQKRGISFEYMV